MGEKKEKPNLFRAKFYLRSYCRIRDGIEELRAKCQRLNDELSCVDVGGMSYDGTHGGNGALTSVEAQVSARIEKREQINNLLHEIASLELQRTVMNNALAKLSEDDRKILLTHYTDGLPWYDVAEIYGYSYDRIRHKGMDALRRFASYL